MGLCASREDKDIKEKVTINLNIEQKLNNSCKIFSKDSNSNIQNRQ